jgi:hypothetical protein
MGRSLSLALLALLASAMGSWPARTDGAVRLSFAGPAGHTLWLLSSPAASKRSVSLAAVTATVRVVVTQAAAASAGGQAHITGRVTTSDGQLVPGASVIVVAANGGIAGHTISGPDGTYDVEGLPDGAYFVDFELTGFDLARRNQVRATMSVPSHADAVLDVSPICECVSVTPRQPLQNRVGQVLSASGNPLPHASLHVDEPRPESALADSEGRFAFRVPIDGAVALTASESGFQSATQQVSGATAAPVVFRLKSGNSAGVPDAQRLRRPCCPGDFFTQGR